MKWKKAPLFLEHKGVKIYYVLDCQNFKCVFWYSTLPNRNAEIMDTDFDIRKLGETLGVVVDEGIVHNYRPNHAAIIRDAIDRELVK